MFCTSWGATYKMENKGKDKQVLSNDLVNKTNVAVQDSFSNPQNHRVCRFYLLHLIKCGKEQIKNCLS